MSKSINLTLKVWRQKNAKSKGHFETYLAENVDTDCSFLEMLDVVNEDLNKSGKDPIAFDHDCREGICGSCGARYLHPTGPVCQNGGGCARAQPAPPEQHPAPANCH